MGLGFRPDGLPLRPVSRHGGLLRSPRGRCSSPPWLSFQSRLCRRSARFRAIRPKSDDLGSMPLTQVHPHLSASQLVPAKGQVGYLKDRAAKLNPVLPVANSASAKTPHSFTRSRLSVLTLTNIGSASDFKPYSSGLPLPCLRGATRINGSRRFPSYGEATANNNATSLSSNTSLRLPGQVRFRGAEIPKHLPYPRRTSAAAD